jgi:hypothetical protein
MSVLLTLRGMITTLPHDTALFKLDWSGPPRCRGSREHEPSDLYRIDRPLARSANRSSLIVASWSSNPCMSVPLGASRFARIPCVGKGKIPLPGKFLSASYTIQLSWLPSPQTAQSSPAPIARWEAKSIQRAALCRNGCKVSFCE